MKRGGAFIEIMKDRGGLWIGNWDVPGNGFPWAPGGIILFYYCIISWVDGHDKERRIRMRVKVMVTNVLKNRVIQG